MGFRFGVPGFVFRVPGFGIQVSGARLRVAGFGVTCLVCRGLGFRIQNSVFSVWG